MIAVLPLSGHNIYVHAPLRQVPTRAMQHALVALQ